MPEVSAPLRMQPVPSGLFSEATGTGVALGVSREEQLQIL